MSIYIKEPHQPAKGCLIWLHGLGADAQDMQALAEQLPLKTPCRHVFLDAPVRPVTLNGGLAMRAWYDITGNELVDREDEKGLEASEQYINEVIAQQMAAGFSSEQIVLVGFSQGGAMALLTGLRATGRLGGIAALSAYLPLAATLQPTVARQTPIFCALGTQDTMVLPEWTRLAVEKMGAWGFNQLVLQQYPMGHAVCMDEVHNLALWLDTQVAVFCGGERK